MKKTYILLAILSMAGYAWLGWNLVEDSSAPTACPVNGACLFKAVTHLPCPSCGTTRALVLLMEGEVRGSLLVNPFGAVLGLMLIIVPIWILLDTIRKSNGFFRCYSLAERVLATNKWISASAIAVVLLNWFWNISKGL